MSAMPKIVYANGAGRPPGRRPDELPPQQHDARPRRRTPATRTIKVASVGNFVAGDKITVDQAANGYGKGDPEIAHDHRGRHGRRDRHRHHARPAAQPQPRERPLRRGLARRHEHARHAGLQPRLVVDAEGRPADRPGLHRTGAGATCRSCRRARGRPRKISAVVQHSAAPRNRRATFDSDNATLDAVFELMQRSGIYSSEEVFLDTPTREKGQFTGDTVDISYANMIAVRRPQRDRPRDPRDPLLRDALVEGGLQRLLHRRAAAVLVPEHRHPGPRERRLPERRQHARHPRLHADDARLGVALLRAVGRQGAARVQLRDAEVGRQLRQDEHRHAPATPRAWSTTCSAAPAPTSTGSSTGRRRCATATRSTTTRRARSTTRTRSAPCAPRPRPRASWASRRTARSSTPGRTT